MDRAACGLPGRAAWIRVYTNPPLDLACPVSSREPSAATGPRFPAPARTASFAIPEGNEYLIIFNELRIILQDTKALSSQGLSQFL